jgi:hypothetical protein
MKYARFITRSEVEVAFMGSERERLGTVKILGGVYYVIDVLRQVDHDAWTERLNDWIDADGLVELTSEEDMAELEGYGLTDSEIWYGAPMARIRSSSDNYLDDF